MTLCVAKLIFGTHLSKHAINLFISDVCVSNGVQRHLQIALVNLPIFIEVHQEEAL